MAAPDRAYTFAKERILDGRFPGGELISEGDVASEVGLSRTPVREAFLRLESEGLLRLYPKRGALVVPVSAAEVESIMETRLLVERHAVAKLIEAGTDVRAALDAAIDSQERHARAGRRTEFVAADREFHRIFLVETGNPILVSLHDSLRDRQSRMGLVALRLDADRVRRILDEHRRLVAAVTERNADAADAIMREHLGAMLAVLRDATRRLAAA